MTSLGLSSQDLMERLDALLCGDGSESLKSLCLKLLLCLVTVSLSLSLELVPVHLLLQSPGVFPWSLVFLSWTT